MCTTFFFGGGGGSRRTEGSGELSEKVTVGKIIHKLCVYNMLKLLFIRMC